MQIFGKAVPTDASAFGCSTILPISDMVNDMATLYEESRTKTLSYQGHQLSRLQIAPEEVGNSPVFQETAREIVRIFREYFLVFSHVTAAAFARYVAKRMVDYLVSDDVVPYWDTRTKLLFAVTDIEWRRGYFDEPWRALPARNTAWYCPAGQRSWHGESIITHSPIRTPDGAVYASPAPQATSTLSHLFRKKPLARSGTEEEALRLGYELQRPGAS